MYLLKYFDKLSLRPENAKELKGLILDLAIRGRLTEEWRKQNPNVESASVLLERIKEEKARLIKEKKIRKQKNFSEITDNEQDHRIPNNWIWCRMQDYLDVRDGTHDTPKYVENGIPLVTSKNLYTGQLDFTKIKYISTQDHLNISKRSKVNKGDILFAMIGTIGNPVIVNTEEEFSIKNVALFKFYNQKDYENSFVLFYLLKISKELKENADGAVQSFVSLTKLRKQIFPLPPLAEQKAIVQIVNQLMEEVDQLEAETTNRIKLRQDFIQSSLHQLTTGNSQQAWFDLQPHFKSFFDTEESIDNLKEAILQLAVQGKLTKQWREKNPIVEPASVLLERIKEEKARLLEEKKIKKEKPLPEISNKEIPFELPKNWVWCRMWELCPNISSGSTPPKTYFKEKGIPYLKVYNIRNQEIDFEYKSQYVDQEYHHTKLKRSILTPGDVIYNIVGPPLGKTAIIPNDFPEWNCNQAIAFFKPVLKEMNIWIYTYLLSKIYLKDIELIGTAGQDNISVTKSKMIKVPLPPIEEQKVLVKIVNQLMDNCEQMKSEIENRNELSKDFLQSSIREVMEQTNTLS